MHLSVKIPDNKEFEQIKQFIQKYELDNRALKIEEFIIALKDETLVGFGRLRDHKDCIELCSLGTVKKKRKQGIAKAIVNELLKKVQEKIYLVTIIPDFFTPFGFKISDKYPASIQSKIEYCENAFVVEEQYVVMVFQKE